MQYVCPTCGYRVFSGPPGTGELCRVCGWRDDLMHLRFPQYGGMPNGMSLLDAQLNYALVGFPEPAEERDPDWRRIDTDVDDLPRIPVDFDGLAEPEDPLSLYYWLPPDRSASKDSN